MSGRCTHLTIASPHTLELACRALAERGGRPIAGGTDLPPQMRAGRLVAERLVDLSRLHDLRAIVQEDGMLHTLPVKLVRPYHVIGCETKTLGSQNCVSHIGRNTKQKKGRIGMATYMLFGTYSRKSLKEISAARTEKALELIKENGGEYKAGYALLGEKDVVVIVDLPGIEQAIKVSVGLARMLGIAFTTAPAVSLEEFDELVG